MAKTEAVKKKDNIIEEKNRIKSSISGKLRRYYAKTVETATPEQLYKACAFTVRDEIMDKCWKTATKRSFIIYLLSF